MNRHVSPFLAQSIAGVPGIKMSLTRFTVLDFLIFADRKSFYGCFMCFLFSHTI